MYGNCKIFLLWLILWLISNLIPLWSENILWMISVLSSLLRLVARLSRGHFCRMSRVCLQRMGLTLLFQIVAKMSTGSNWLTVCEPRLSPPICSLGPDSHGGEASRSSPTISTLVAVPFLPCPFLIHVFWSNVLFLWSEDNQKQSSNLFSVSKVFTVKIYMQFRNWKDSN